MLVQAETSSKGLEGKWKELVGKVASKTQIEELMTWAEEENIVEEEGVTKNVKKRLEELTVVTRVRQNCADMVASTLASRPGTRLFNIWRLIEYLKEATRSARLGTRSVLGAAGKVEI